MLLQCANDGRHVNVTGQCLGYQVGQVVCVARLGPALPGHNRRRGQDLQRPGGGIHGGVDGQVGLVHPVQFFGTGMDVHQLLFGPWYLQQRVPTAGHLAQARANRQNQVSVFDARRQPGVDANADIARVQRVMVVKGVLKPERIAHRQLPVFRKALQCLRGLHRPAPTARNDHGSLCFE